MIKFPVPQFIDVEDRIVGQLTIKQFLWLLLGGGIILAIYYFGHLQFWAFLTLSAPIATLFISFAFVKIQGQSFVTRLGAMISYLTKPKLFIWQRKNNNG
ncbi:MAG: hypothetical protein COU81_01455 [Candidatus Portnoybacteria bacterium CG10_big_fil_rev_8_21_14_0_10_36_7]|uniref:PrgI family protein n=1 Tax=Candidatus Portnoybacteria bacterium CG10_big_fil_rev_8_21_14_0_10_36_7 TaxID=1974812 RepID=A0A2M8KEH1_9BACT|nr:MAG: hypothetical protein COU81_01455 [Candidatus Portnoybacteria bacterium CG10_big_fil_rev_8_21_14_0_10_36_7]